MRVANKLQHTLTKVLRVAREVAHELPLSPGSITSPPQRRFCSRVFSFLTVVTSVKLHHHA